MKTLTPEGSNQNQSQTKRKVKKKKTEKEIEETRKEKEKENNKKEDTWCTTIRNFIKSKIKPYWYGFTG